MPVLTEEGIECPRLIILRGSPAIGKTTLAKKIASMNPAKKKAHIPVDDFQLYDARKPSLMRERFAIRNAAILTKSFLLEDFDAVVDYVFDNIEDEEGFMSLILGDEFGKLNDIYVQKFYLDASLETVLKRNQSRRGKRGEYMAIPLLKKLYAKTDITKGKVKNEVVLDTSDWGVEKTARLVLSYDKAYKNDEEFANVIFSQKNTKESQEVESEDSID